jgi:hypothetical protein
MEFTNIMKIRRQLFSITILLILSACRAELLNTPTFSYPSTPSISPTNSKTSTVTIFPIQTTSPTQTAIPVPVYYKGVDAPSLEAYTDVTLEQLILIGDKVLNEPDSLDTSGKAFHAEPLEGFFTGEIIHSVYGIGCIGKASVKLVNPHGGPDEWVQVWKFIGPDKKKAVAFFYLGGPRNNEYLRSEAVRKHNLIKEYVTGTSVNLFIPSYITSESYKEQANPLVWDLTNGASNEDKNAHREFRTTGIIPERFRKMVVWLWQL